MGFKEFVTEDSDAVISQIRQIRDQMRVIKLKRDLEKEKDELQTLMQQKIGVSGAIIDIDKLYSGLKKGRLSCPTRSKA